MKIGTFTLLLLAAFTTHSQTKELFASKYYNWYSNHDLNAHVFLYGKANACKFGKKPADSLALYSFADKREALSKKEIAELNEIVAFYKDSLLSHDILFDSLMREISDVLVTENGLKHNYKTKWQNLAAKNLKKFIPYFDKYYWAGIDSTNKAWLDANKGEIARLEESVVPELEKIYQTKLPAGAKLRIDLTCYATWAGAFSYKDGYCHVIFSSVHPSNQGNLAAEVTFHETSHFLVDKLNAQIAAAVPKGVEVKQGFNLWHNIIFYTTGYVLQKKYAAEGKTFVPYYEQMKFADRFPDFKLSVEACKLYWNPFMETKFQSSQRDRAAYAFDSAVKSMVGYLLEKK
jgi:hypothetical protein